MHRDDGGDNSEDGMPVDSPKHNEVIDHVARRIADRAETRIEAQDQRLDRLDADIKDVKGEIREGFKQTQGSFTRVHARQDEGNERSSSRYNRLLLAFIALLATALIQIVVLLAT